MLHIRIESGRWSLRIIEFLFYMLDDDDDDDDDDELFCGMVDRQKAFILISSRDNCHRSSLSRISDTALAGLNVPRTWVQAFLNEVMQ